MTVLALIRLRYCVVVNNVCHITQCEFLEIVEVNVVTILRPRQATRREQAGFHTRVPLCHHAVPCRMPPYSVTSSHPLQFPPPQFRGSRQSVGSLVSYKSLSTPEFRQLRPSEPLAQELLVGATKQSVHVTPDVAPGDSPAALEQLAIPAIATTSATGRGAMSGAVRGP